MFTSPELPWDELDKEEAILQSDVYGALGCCPEDTLDSDPGWYGGKVNFTAKLGIVKGKGKGKQTQREDSVDSISATPKQRKKLGPRKKFDTLPPQTQELLGIAGTGSTSASVAGDVTPSASRPASPALTSISATVYELDEPIPALRKAKKVDDTVMMKRVRNLEEAQRKVWTNIARRDVPKVRSPCVARSVC